jgi:uncharacterized protein DUF2846
MISCRSVFRALAFAAVLALFAACASTPPPAAPPVAAAPPQATASPAPAVTEAAPGSGEVATVYIYRPKAFVGWALNPTVMLDGKDLVNVRNGRIFVARFQPGKHVFKMDDGKSGAELDLQAGQNYYFKMDIVMGFWKGGGRLTLVAGDQGKLEVQGLEPVDTKEIEDPAFRAR